MGSQLMVAQAMAKFKTHLANHMGEPITLVTIRQFAVMVTEVVNGMLWTPPDDE